MTGDRAVQRIRNSFGALWMIAKTFSGAKAKSFAGAKEGATAILLAVGMPAVAGVVGFAVDYSAVSGSRSRLQAVVDSTAIAIAREMTLTPVTSTRAQALAEQYVAANIPANTPYKIIVKASLVENNLAVRIVGDQQLVTPFGLIERMAGVTEISATALARVTASSAPQKVCLVSLGEKVNGGIYMHNGSNMTAPGCVLHSNSTKKDAIILNAGSNIQTNLLCARGGVKNMASSVNATIVTDCPVMQDPLATKPEPVVSPVCIKSKIKIKSGTLVLNPGTYCNGVEISGTAVVTLNPGIYTFKDGPLVVQDSATIKGNGVSLLFSGRKSYFRFLNNSLIELTAPTAGASAGMLLWETKGLIPGLASWLNGGCGGNVSVDDDINGTACSVTGALVKSKKTNEHHINSDRARTLTGTIYLKQGLLLVDSTRPIADLSPYTIMVVQKLDLFDGPNLTLNSNYNGSVVPVPTGLGPSIGATQVRLGN